MGYDSSINYGFAWNKMIGGEDMTGSYTVL